MFDALLEYVKGLFAPQSVDSIVNEAQTVVDKLNTAHDHSWNQAFKTGRKLAILHDKVTVYENEAMRARTLAKRWEALVNG